MSVQPTDLATEQATSREKKRVNIPVPDDDEPRFRDLLGSPPLMAGESGRRFLEFRRSIYADVKPCGPIEEMFVNSLIYAYWSFLQYTAHKASLMKSSSTDGIDRILRVVIDDDERKELMKKYALGEAEAIRQVDAIMHSLSFGPAEIASQTLAANISDIQKIEGQIAAKDNAWRKALRELEGYRAILALKFKMKVGVEEDQSSRIQTSELRQLIK